MWRIKKVDDFKCKVNHIIALVSWGLSWLEAISLNSLHGGTRAWTEAYSGKCWCMTCAENMVTKKRSGKAGVLSVLWLSKGDHYCRILSRLQHPEHLKNWLGCFMSTLMSSLDHPSVIVSDSLHWSQGSISHWYSAWVYCQWRRSGLVPRRWCTWLSRTMWRSPKVGRVPAMCFASLIQVVSINCITIMMLTSSP